MTSPVSAISAALALTALIAVKLTHLQALVLFDLLISIAFGFLGRRQPKERVKYLLGPLLLFLLGGVGIGWAMYPCSH